MVPLEQYLNRCYALLLLFIFGCIDLDSKEVSSFNVQIFNFHSKNIYECITWFQFYVVRMWLGNTTTTKATPIQAAPQPQQVNQSKGPPKDFKKEKPYREKSKFISALASNIDSKAAVLWLHLMLLYRKNEHANTLKMFCLPVVIFQSVQPCGYVYEKYIE